MTISALEELTNPVVSGEAAVTIDCNYSGTDEPDSVTWLINDAVVADSDDDIAIAEGAVDSNDRYLAEKMSI